MAVQLFKSGTLIKVIESGWDDQVFNPSSSKYARRGDNFILKDNVSKVNRDLGDYTNIQDESGTPYASEQDVVDFLDNAFGAVSLVDAEGEVGVQNPLSVDGDSVYIQDVDFDNSDFTGWVGNPENLFVSPFSDSITNSTSDNPKQIIVAFKRTVKALQIGFGENNGGDFSNVKVSLLGSGGAQRSIFDRSTDSNKLTSLNSEFENEVFNSILVEFFTADPVSLSNIIIFKAKYDTVQIQGRKPNGDFNTVNTNFLGNLLVSLDEQKDAFGRLKTAEPFTIFDNSLTTELSDTLYWSELINGTASSSYDGVNSSIDMAVATDGDYIVRQTKQRFKYQPAKSHEFFITGLFSTEAGIRKRAGLVDYDNKSLVSVSNVPQNGVFFENNGGVLSWNIAKNGVITETVTQENWNIDTLDGQGNSGFELDIDYVNILTGQLEWLGVGVVLVGFATGGGEIAYCHAFQHASVASFVDVYMRTANLPLSYELTSITGSGAMKQICNSVISGGGFNPVGQSLAVQNTSSVGIGSNDTELLIGIRLKENSFEYTIEPTQLSILSLSNGNTLWTLSVNPTYTGTVVWVDVPNSEVQQAVNNGNEVTDEGIVLARGSFSNNTDSLNEPIDTAVKIGKSLSGTNDELWLFVTALGNENYHGTINFKELI
jgi:hypothetical protein